MPAGLFSARVRFSRRSTRTCTWIFLTQFRSSALPNMLKQPAPPLQSRRGRSCCSARMPPAFPNCIGSGRSMAVELWAKLSITSSTTAISRLMRQCRRLKAFFTTTRCVFTVARQISIMSVLHGRRAIITGAAGAIGRATALRFVRDGASVGLTDINVTELSITAGLARDLRGNVIEAGCDVRREQDVAAAVSEMAEKMGGLEILIANAGIMPHSDESVLAADFEQWRNIIDVNLFGIASFVKCAVPHIASAGGGAIVTMGSFLAVVGCSYPQDGYTASKSAVAALTRSLAVQLGPKNIRVNGMAPGPILTPHVEKFLPRRIKE